MSAKQREWSIIDDFRPGIFQRPSHHLPRGAAVEEGTYGCKSNESGDLIPGPVLSNFWQIDDISVNEPEFETVENGGTGHGLYWITGLQIAHPVFSDGNVVGINQNNSELFVAFEYIVNTDNRHRELWRFHRHTGETWEQIYDETDTFPYEETYKPARATMGVTRSNSAAPLESGPSVLVVCQGDGILKGFPDDTASAVTGTVNLDKPGALFPQPDMVTVHQGRVVVFPLSLTAFGLDVVYAHNELMYWFAVNDYTTLSSALTGSYFSVLFGYETPAGYDFAISLSANELLLMKRYGGAVMVRGDLDHPQAINLPNVKSPGFSESWPVQTGLGLIYVVDNDGVYTWKGGDTSDLLSPGLYDNFWRSTRDRPVAPGNNIWRAASKLTLFGDLIVTPNNWFYDTIHAPGASQGGGGWWRLNEAATFFPPDPEDPESVGSWATTKIGFHNEADWTGRWLYQTPWAIRYAEGDDVLWEWDRALPNTSYAWKSQPIAESIDRQINVREVVAVVSGHGRVNITVYGRAEDGSPDTLRSDSIQEIFVDSDFPIVVRRDIALKGALVQLELTSNEDNGEGGTAGFGAPVVHELRLGYDPREQAGKKASEAVAP